MRVDPRATVAGCPALAVRQAWRKLRELGTVAGTQGCGGFQVSGEKALMLAAPHRVLLAADEPAPGPPAEAPRRRKARDCPF